MLTVLRGGRGLGGIVLVLVIAWALAAVLLLTGTLIAANQIDTRVASIDTSVNGANQNLDAVRLAARTGRVAGRIRESAAPLSGQFTQITASVGSIDGSARSIFGTAGAINRNADSINVNVRSIGGRVGSIDRSVGSINGRVRSIRSNAGSINARVAGIRSNALSIERRVRGINRSAGSINTSVASINTSAGSISRAVPPINSTARLILLTSRSIDVGANGINVRAHRVAEIVGNDILPDTNEILDEAGEVDLHANSIDCSATIQAVRRLGGRADTGACGTHEGEPGVQGTP
ncbi:MAG: hypothetical protein ACR2NV_09655 [Thermoleophilaceae bacterium]